MAINPTLLYVDDEELNLFIFSEVFVEDFNVITARSGEEGLVKVTEYGDSISIVVTDMKMTGMNGIKFIKEARIHLKQANYFVLSGYSSDAEIEQAINDGLVLKLFTKPVDFDDVRHQIKMSIGNGI